MRFQFDHLLARNGSAVEIKAIRRALRQSLFANSVPITVAGVDRPQREESHFSLERAVGRCSWFDRIAHFPNPTSEIAVAAALNLKGESGTDGMVLLWGRAHRL
jgi:hypothetical protein